VISGGSSSLRQPHQPLLPRTLGVGIIPDSLSAKPAMERGTVKPVVIPQLSSVRRRQHNGVDVRLTDRDRATIDVKNFKTILCPQTFSEHRGTAKRD